MNNPIAEADETIVYKYDDADEFNRIWRYTEPRTIDGDRPLPSPRSDMEGLKADLDTHGYCLVENAMPPEMVERIRQRIVDQFAGETKLGRAHYSPYGDERITNLLNKGAVFRDVMVNPVVDALLEHALGDGFLLSTFSSVRTAPGSLAQGLHTDQSFIGFPTPVAMVANAVWMLDDFTEENGGTRIVPGSHLWTPEQVEAMHEGLGVAGGDGIHNPPNTVAATGPAGTCMVFDGRLLHGTGRNTSTNAYRAAIFNFYCRPFMRPFENAFLSIDDDVMMQLSSEIRLQLGYRPWSFVGGCESPGYPAPLDVVRPVARLGEAHP